MANEFSFMGDSAKEYPHGQEIDLLRHVFFLLAVLQLYFNFPLSDRM